LPDCDEETEPNGMEMEMGIGYPRDFLFVLSTGIGVFHHVSINGVM
jgi:hypothetical protein